MPYSISRRAFLGGLTGAAAWLACGGHSLAWAGPERTGIPIAMFHKVDDAPRYPEDMASDALASILGYAWDLGFSPVNMSDILLGRVDRVTPRGRKPLGITVDDTHRSVVYTMTRSQHPDQRNQRSFYEIFVSSTMERGFEPRATLFASENSNDRLPEPGGYFGNSSAFPLVVKTLAKTPAVEIGYHTRAHKRMTKMGAEETLAALKDQMDQFAQMGLLDRIVKIFSYPYGMPPTDKGVAALKTLGFLGAVEAAPGVNEGRTGEAPLCDYDGKLLADPFHIPRINVGPGGYDKNFKIYMADPVSDFDKDIRNRAPLYVSKG